MGLDHSLLVALCAAQRQGLGGSGIEERSQCGLLSGEPAPRRIQGRAVLDGLVEAGGEVIAPPVLKGEQDVVGRPEKREGTGHFVEPQRRRGVDVRRRQYLFQYTTASSPRAWEGRIELRQKPSRHAAVQPRAATPMRSSRTALVILPHVPSRPSSVRPSSTSPHGPITHTGQK